MSAVFCSYCDKDGNLWFGTNGGGVSRYDGKSFTNYTMADGLASNQIFSIFQDKDGNMWFGNYNGLSKYDGKSFTQYAPQIHGYGSTIYRCITQDQNGNMWFGSAYGFWKYNGKSFKAFMEKDGMTSDYVICQLQDKNGDIWCGTDTGVSTYDGKSFRNYTIAQGLISNYVQSVLKDKNGDLWFGTNAGISKFDGRIFKNFTMAQGLVNNNVTSLLEDKNNHIWIGTDSGVSEYNGKSFKNYTVSNGLAGNEIRSMVQDKNEDIWFTTAYDGVCRYSGNAFTSYKKAQGLPNDLITSIYEQRNGIMWFGTSKAGAVRFNGKALTFFSAKQGLAGDAIFCIREDKKKNIWFGTFDGVFCYDGKSFTNYTTAQGLGANSVWSITEDTIGNIYFGTYGGGVSKLSGDKKTMTTFTDTTGGGNVHSVLADSKGILWIGIDYGGVTVYDGKIFKNYKEGLADSLGAQNIFEDKNKNIWIGTVSGISRYDGKTFMNFTSEQGLPDNEITGIVEGRNGIIWIGTRLGFSGLKFKAIKTGDSDANSDVKFSNDVLKAKYQPVFENYNFKTGYPVRNIANNNSMYVDTSNMLWAGTGDKLIKFNYSAIHKNNYPPKVFIQDIKVHNQNICWYDLTTQKVKTDSSTTPPNIIEEVSIFGKPLSVDQRNTIHKKLNAVRFDSITSFYDVPINLVLPYNDNDITFDFAAIETSRPNLVRYQYKLQGYAKDWNIVTDKASATFGNMHEGKYTFKLKAKSPGGIWSKPIEYNFQILPPWYRTWWAYALYIFAFVIALWSFIKWRVSILKREKVLLEEKVTHRTEQLKQSLDELKSTQAQLIQSEKMASLGELTAGIAHEIQNPLNFVNNFSEVNREMVDELQEELRSGNIDEAIAISNDIKENEEKINHHGKRADAIVKGMLQHSRKSSGQKELTDINALCDEYLKLSYHGMRAKDKSFNAELKTDFDETNGKINIVPQDIGRVLLNLFNNAFYAVNQQKGRNLSEYKPTISVSTRKMDDHVEIKVKDNGSGIPQNIVDKIYQPFFTTKPTGQGTGLGLSLSYDIIKAHGGEIKVESKEGNGTEFVIQLLL